MEVLERTKHKVVLRQRRHKLLWTVLGCLMLTLLFYLLDARHPKSSLHCARHAVLPDNNFEAERGSHVEDIDCNLVVRPTRTALDLTFLGEISYSFEIVSARLVRPPKRPTSGERLNCRERCPPGKACDCGVGGGGVTGGVDHRSRAHGAEKYAAGGEEEEERQGAAHYAMHMGVNDVATLVLEDNQGITYDFYTFQDESVAEQMLKKVESFIREAREGVTAPSSSKGAPAVEQAPLELEVLYDDSWLDEMACALFLFAALALMTLPYTEVVEFDAGTGAMALDRWNLFQCGVFRYSCALENVSKLEITEALVYMVSAHAFEHLRQTKEFGLRVLFSLPAHQGKVPPLSPQRVNASAAHGVDDANAGGEVAEAAVFLPPASRRRRWDRFFDRIFCRRWGRFYGGRRPLTRNSGTVGGFLYLDLLFERKALDDRKLRVPVELVNDLLRRFANDAEGAGGRKREGVSDGQCCVCFRRRARVVTFPCMHMATCPHCSESLSACPLCRAGISEKHTVFI